MEYRDNKKIVPINRNNLFFSEESYQFELDIAKNYLEQDMNQTVILYQVDLTNTNINNVYKEAKKDEIRFKTPVELHVIYTIDEADLKTYNNSKGAGAYLQTGKLKFNVLQATLDELQADIKRGDYIGVQVDIDHMEYFVVTNDGMINYDNRHTMYGVRNFYRSIECVVVDPNEFRGK